ncbi:MAG: hypothetical protein ACJ75F_03565 [Flavisolibacter sp.]|jgi:hypothetical protein
MKKKLFILLSGIILSLGASAQKVDSIYFHLYTDSLKKGFFNYINVDGKLTNGEWTPLDSSEVLFLSDAGFFKGNDLFIDSSYRGETARVKVILKSNPAIWKETVIYIRKRGFTEHLKTNDEILDELRQKGKKSKG